ncbi:MAG: squalene/phytoene synthase family protein [Hyphomicrobium sp.]
MNPTGGDEAVHEADWDRAVAEAARSHAPDHYLAALLAPRAARRDLVTLAAYVGEISRVLLTVHDARLAEIRLQWWREALEAGGGPAATATEGRSGHPVADALAALILRADLPLDDVLAPIDAGDHLLVVGLLDEEKELAAFIEATAVVPFRLASRLLGATGGGEEERLLTAAGRAYGLTRLAVDLPRHLALARRPVPLSRMGNREPGGLSRAELSAAIAQATGNLMDDARAHVAVARNDYRTASAPVRAAALPAALVEPYFKALHARTPDAFGPVADVSPLSRAWHLWRACRLRRF